MFNNSTEGDYVNSLTLTELYSGWTENRAVWNKSAHAVLEQLRQHWRLKCLSR